MNEETSVTARMIGIERKNVPDTTLFQRGDSSSNRVALANKYKKSV